MEKQFFETIVNGNHKLGCNEYVMGKISGIEYALCGQGAKKQFPWDYNPETGNHRMKTFCTEEEYTNFTNTIEYLYPGLCIFNYQERYD